jgi:hypothetical protein
MMTGLGWSQGACQEGPDQFREVIKRGEKFLKDYPQSEVSDNIRLELAHAYATWWNLSGDEPNPPYSTPETYKMGSRDHRKDLGSIVIVKAYPMSAQPRRVSRVVFSRNCAGCLTNSR